ncbi:MAG: DUF177 domain-containing protein [Sphingomonadales bacterium]|nr:DUF177 domain-containing protein [Sphingomonadales bacterium]
MPPPEFSRRVDIREIGPAPLHLAATAAECAALARRFDLVAIEALSALVDLVEDGAMIRATGRMTADVIQSCAVSAEDLRVHIEAPLALRFLRDTPMGGTEIELSAEDCDDIGFSGTAFDLGEAVAQSLELAIDRFAVGPGAARVRAGLADPRATGPFAPLAALRAKDEPGTS